LSETALERLRPLLDDAAREKAARVGSTSPYLDLIDGENRGDDEDAA